MSGNTRARLRPAAAALLLFQRPGAAAWPPRRPRRFCAAAGSTIRPPATPGCTTATANGPSASRAAIKPKARGRASSRPSGCAPVAAARLRLRLHEGPCRCRVARRGAHRLRPRPAAGRLPRRRGNQGQRAGKSLEVAARYPSHDAPEAAWIGHLRHATGERRMDRPSWGGQAVERLSMRLPGHR